jgi:AraC family transcriptional regulator
MPSGLRQQIAPMVGRRYDGGGVILEAVVAAPGLRFSSHTHEAPHVCAVIAGSFDERVHLGSRRCTQGTTRVSPSGDPHTLEFGTLTKCLILVVEQEHLIEAPSTFRARSFFEDPAPADVARRAFDALGSATAGDGLVLESLAWELIAQVERKSAGRREALMPRWLRQAREQLHEALVEPLSISELAAQSGVSREHLARSFRQHLGLPIGEYVRRLRLDEACRRLVSTRDTLSRIALETGFADQSHLTRWCLRERGATPAEIRRARGRNITRVQDLLKRPLQESAAE